MRRINLLILFLSVMVVFYNCSSTKVPVQETILDGITHLEDSLIYEIPHSPRLCDALDVNKSFVDIGDIKLYTEIEGSGTPMVLINGGPGGTHYVFHPWLSEAKKNFKLIYYDQRGCGQSDYEAGEGYSFDQAVEDLEKLREALKIEKWILLGHSYGGGIAQYYTIKYPERVIGQVLVGSVSMMELDNIRAGREQTYYSEAETKRKAELVSLVRARKISMAQYTYNREINGGWKRESFIKPSRERMTQAVLYDNISDPAYASDWNVYDFENVFLECPVPTLILEGKYDLIWTTDRPEIMGKFHPQADVLVFDSSGHNSFADEPARFVNEVEKWAETFQTPSAAQLLTWTESVDGIIGEQLILINSSKDFISTIRKNGADAAAKHYMELKAQQPEKQIFFEAPMNALGYEFLFAEKLTEAVVVFRLNVDEFPDSWNAYDSYGETLLALGQREKAIKNYERSVELNPENENGVRVLKDLIVE